MEIKVIDNSKKTAEELKSAVLRALERCGMQAEGYAVDLVPADTGNLRQSISHKIDSAEQAAYVGTSNEYAAYVELGTGVYYPGGRQDPWTYQDANGNWHMTHGQRAQPYLKPAVADHSSIYRKIIEAEMKNG